MSGVKSLPNAVGICRIPARYSQSLNIFGVHKTLALYSFGLIHVQTWEHVLPGSSLAGCVGIRAAGLSRLHGQEICDGRHVHKVGEGGHQHARLLEFVQHLVENRPPELLHARPLTVQL